MKETNEKVYRCEFCNKAIISKGSMVVHEKNCKKNPKNQHQCFKFCKWLEKEKDEYGNNYFYCGNINCGLHNKDLYSYKLERSYRGKNRILQDNLVRMPLKCEFYEVQDGHDIVCN